MTSSQRKKSEGISPRHRRACDSRDGDACNCGDHLHWQAWAWDPASRKKIRKTFPTLAAAKAWRADATVAIRKQELRAIRSPTVAEAGDELIVGMKDGSIRARGGRQFKPSTIRSYEAALRERIVPALGRRRLSDVNRGDLMTLVERMLREGRDSSTIRNTLMPVRLLYRRALNAGVVSVNPTAGLALPASTGRRDRIATPPEAAVLLDALPEQDRALWAVALYGGLRAGEIGGLDWEAIDLDRGMITVERSWCWKSRTFVEPKTSSGRREVPMVGPLRKLLLEHQLRSGRREGLAFGRDGVRPFNGSALRTRALAAWQAAEVAPLACDVDAERRSGQPLPEFGYLTLHEARHTYCSTALAAGVSPAAVSRYAGHASVAFTLNRYVKALAGTEAGDAARIEAFLAAAN
jgi:integrase